jgi:iron complex outermembrane receptor protein
MARNLPPGNYEIAVESPGFTPYLRRDVRVQSGEAVRLDVVLSVSTVKGQVTVTAKAPAGEGEFETRPQNSREILEIREVRESAAKDVGEALAELEGLWMVRRGGIANDVVLRGFQQGNVNMLIDGARILGACPNHMDPSAFHVDFAEIESVQVTKGPFDIRNQGSLGGTVNVVTKKRADGFRVTPNAAAGSSGYFNPSLQGSYAVGWAYVLGGYSYRRSDVYRDGSGRRVTDYANYTASGRDNRAFDINTGWMKFGLSPGWNQNIEVAYTRQQGGLTLYPYLLMDAIYDNADRASASWSLQPGGMIQRVYAQGYFTRVKHWMTDELRSSSVGAARSYGMATFAGTKALGGRFEVELPDTFLGFETYSRDWNAVNTMRLSGTYTDQPSLPDVRIRTGGVYAQHHRYYGKLRVTAGARLDAAASEARSRSINTDLYWAFQDTASKTASDLNPSATLWATYALPKGLELFGGAGSTVRVPDPQERYFALKRMGSDWVGNPNLVPARNNEADAGIHVRTGRFSLRPTLFYSRLDNFIALYSQSLRHPTMGIMNTAARSYGNVDARVYGGELSYSVAFGRSVLVSGGASYTRGTQHARPEAGIPGGSIAEMPPPSD